MLLAHISALSGCCFTISSHFLWKSALNPKIWAENNRNFNKIGDVSDPGTQKSQHHRPTQPPTLWLLKTDMGCETFFFAHNVTLCNSVTFKFCVTLEFSWHHGNPKPKRFDFYIKYKPVDRTCPFHYHWLELFGLGIESCVAFLKSFSIQQLQQWLLIAGQHVLIWQNQGP